VGGDGEPRRKSEAERLSIIAISYRRLTTFAPLWLESGEHPKLLQEILGHSRISMTLATYSHVIP
jgi:site-specific recombinase XerD